MLNHIDFATSDSFRRHAWAKPILLLLLVAVCLVTFCPEADAAPGGQFVKQALSSKFGRIGGLILGGLMLLAVILLFPLFLYIKYAEFAGIRQTKKDLALLADKYRWFEWPTIRSRVSEAVRSIADVWASGNLSAVAPFMTPEYFASQQQLLRRWQDEGKQIVYRLEKVRRLEPLALSVEDEETHSWIRVLVTVDCIDYMLDQYTKGVVKGDVEKTTGFETIWLLVYKEGQWLLNGIEEGSSTVTWATYRNRVDTRYLDHIRVTQPQQGQDAAQVRSKSGSRSQLALHDSAADQPATAPKRRLVRKPADDEDQ